MLSFTILYKENIWAKIGFPTYFTALLPALCTSINEQLKRKSFWATVLPLSPVVSTNQGEGNRTNACIQHVKPVHLQEKTICELHLCKDNTYLSGSFHMAQIRSRWHSRWTSKNQTQFKEMPIKCFIRGSWHGVDSLGLPDHTYTSRHTHTHNEETDLTIPGWCK